MIDQILFRQVPAYRLAAFRTLFAVITIDSYVPHLVQQIHAYSDVVFHVAWIEWLPVPSGNLILLLIPVLWVASWALFFGIWRRAAAAVLFFIGAYVFAIDLQHYSHNSSFHLTLLFILMFADDGVSLRELLSTEQGGRKCEAWKELLVLWQVGIIFFYATIEKIFSPFWGLHGSYFIYQVGPPTEWLRQMSPALMAKAAGPLSVTTTVLEFFIALVFLMRLRNRYALFVALVFFIGLEILEMPYVFAWDLMAALILFFPSADRSCTVQYDPKSITLWVCSLLDWLRRIQWKQNPGSEKLIVLMPDGGKLTGYHAVKKIVTLIPGPVLFLFLLIRFHASSTGFFNSDKTAPLLPILMAMLALPFFVPGVNDFLGARLYKILSRR